MTPSDRAEQLLMELTVAAVAFRARRPEKQHVVVPSALYDALEDRAPLWWRAGRALDVYVRAAEATPDRPVRRPPRGGAGEARAK